MRHRTLFVFVLLAGFLAPPVIASAEILAMLVYESRVDDSLRELQLQRGATARRDGLAVIDVDPELIWVAKRSSSRKWSMEA